MEWNFACPRWEDRLRAGKSLVPDLPLDADEAARAVGIFNKLRLPDVPDQPSMKEAAGEWQRDIVRSIFGSLVGGIRRVPELLVMVPKKSSKTTMGAAITLTAMLMNIRPRAEMIYIGPTQEVADLAFQQTVGMIEADEYLTKRFHLAHHTKTITDRRNKARLKVKTFDMKVVTGSKPSFILLDELHLMATINGAGRIIGQIRGGMLPNPEAALVMITTQSDEPPAGAFDTELQYARGVRDGRVPSSRLLPILYEFPMSMQRDGSWADPANWHLVLPNLGRPVTLNQLIEGHKDSKEKGDIEERRWASQHLNVQIGIALHENRWPGVDFWEQAANPAMTLDGLLADCDVATIGIDGGGLDDLLGLAVIGREKVTRRWLLWTKAWAHQIALQRRKEIAETLLDFAQDGDLVFCETPTQDIEQVAQICVKVKESGLLPERMGIGLDKLGLPGLVDQLIESGFDVDANEGTITGISQGGYLNPAILGLERKLSDETMIHAGQAMMAWCVSNAKVELKGSSRAITKQAAGKGKIDPFIAALNAAMLMSRNPEPKRTPSFQMLFVG